MARRGGLFIEIAGSINQQFLTGVATLREQFRLLRDESKRLEVVKPYQGFNKLAKEIQGSTAAITRHIQQSRRNVELLTRQIERYNKVAGRALAPPRQLPATGMTGAQVVGRPAAPAPPPPSPYRHPGAVAFTPPVTGARDALPVRQLREFENWTTRATQATKHFGRQLTLKDRILKGISGIFERVNARLRQFAAFVLAAMVVQGFTRALRTAAQTIAEFDQSLRNLEAIVNLTRSQSQLLGNVIKDVSRVTKFSAGEVADGMRVLGQAGLDMQESIATIEAVARLATGTMTDFTRVSDLMTTAIRSFKVEAVLSGRIADIFANAINESKLAVDKLITAFNYVGAAGYQAGLSINEVAGSLMVLADHGIRASTMGTGLRRLMLRMQSASGGLRQDLEALGKSVRDINPEYVGWEQALKNLIPLLWDTRTESVNVAKAAEYFGLRAAQVTSVLIAAVADGTHALNAAIAQTREFGAAARMAETQIEGLSLSYKNLQDRIRLAMIAVGESGLGEFFQNFVDMMAKAATGVEYFFRRYGDLLGAIAKIGGLTLVLALFGKLIGKLGTMILVLPKVQAAISSLTAVLLGTTTATAAAKAGFMGLGGVLSVFLAPIIAVPAIIAGAIYAINRFATSLSNAAREASFASQTFGVLSQGIQDWGRALTDSFGTQEWDDTLQRFREIEIEGRNLAKILEDDLGFALEDVPLKGYHGFRLLQESIERVSLDQLQNQFNAAVEQMGLVMRQSERLNFWFGVEIPESLQRSNRELTFIQRQFHNLSSAFSAFNRDIASFRVGGLEFGLAPVERWVNRVMSWFTPDTDEIEELAKDAIYNMTQSLKRQAQLEDWSIDEMLEGVSKGVDKLTKDLGERAGPAIDLFLSDMTSHWSAPAVAEIKRVETALLNLQKWGLEEGQITLREFQNRLKALEIDHIISDEAIDNLYSIEDAMEIAEMATYSLQGEFKDFLKVVNDLFEGHTSLEEALHYVNREMDISETLAERVTRALKRQSAEIGDTKNAYEVFVKVLEGIGPSAARAFEELSGAQRAAVIAQRDEIAKAGEDIEKMVLDHFKMTSFEEIEDRLSPTDIRKTLAEIMSDAEDLDDVRGMMRQAMMDVVQEIMKGVEARENAEREASQRLQVLRDEQLLHVRENSLEALEIEKQHAQDSLRLAQENLGKKYGNTVENQAALIAAQKEYQKAIDAIDEYHLNKRLEQIEINTLKQLLQVKSGSFEALKIEQDAVKQRLEIAKEEYDKNPTPDNLKKLLQLRQENKNKVLEVERALTDMLIDEYDRRSLAREQALRRQHLELDRELISGQVDQYSAEGRRIDLDMADVKSRIDANENYILSLSLVDDAEEQLKEAQQRRIDLQLELFELRNQKLEHNFNVYSDTIDRIQLKQDEELLNVRQNTMEELRIRERHAQDILEQRRKEHEARPEDAAAHAAYIQAQRELNELRLQIEDRYWEDRELTIDTALRRELLNLREGSLRAIQAEENATKQRLIAAHERYKKDPTPENLNELYRLLQEHADKVLAVERKLTDDLISEFNRRASERSRSFERDAMHIDRQVVTGTVGAYDARTEQLDLEISRIDGEIKANQRLISVLRAVGDEKEQIPEIENRNEELQDELFRKQTERIEHGLNKYRETIAERTLLRDRELQNVRRNTMEELKIQESHAEDVLEEKRKAYERRPEDRATEEAFVRAEQELLDVRLRIFEKYWEDRGVRLDIAQREELLKVREGSLAALKIEQEFARRALEEARARFEAQRTEENYIALLEAKKSYRDSRRAVEQRITQDLITEVDKRISAAEREFRARERRLREESIRGQIEESDRIIVQAELNIENIKNQIRERQNLIDSIDDTIENEERLKELRRELRDLNDSLKDSELDRLEAQIRSTDLLFDREQRLADLRRDIATVGIDRGAEALLESQRPGVIGTFGYEEKLAYEVLERKYQAEKAHQERVRQLWAQRLEEIKKYVDEESSYFQEKLMQKELWQKQTNERMIQLEKEKHEANIIANGTFWEQMKLGQERAQKNIEGWGEFTARLGETMYMNFGRGFANAFVEFGVGAESAKEAFRSFAYDFFKNIAQMIAQQLMFNALAAVMGAVSPAASTAARTTSSIGAYGEGGEVEGSSPHSKADNIIARVTAGEWVMPVKSVQHYGKEFMQRINTLKLPKYADGGEVEEERTIVKMRNIFSKVPRLHTGLNPDEFHAIIQKGERVVSRTDAIAEKRMLEDINRKLDLMERQKQRKEKGIRVVNVLDPDLFSDWATSSSGEKVMKNFIKRNSAYIKQVIK